MINEEQESLNRRRDEENKNDDRLIKLEESVTSLIATVMGLTDFIKDASPKKSKKKPSKTEEIES